MTRLGVVFRPQLPPERLVPVARAADAAGLDDLWLWEDCFFESGIACAAAALATTERTRVGIGLLPVPLRNVALTAMEIATLHRMFPGRLAAGVGHGNQEWMAQAGVAVDSQMTLLREYLTALRALLRGDRVSTDGRYVKLDGVALDWPPPGPAPILAGAVGPRTLRLTGEAADGTVLSGESRPATVRRARALIDAGRVAAGRNGGRDVVVYLHAATGPDATARVHREMASWGEPPLPEYAQRVTAQTVAAAAGNLAVAGADTVVLQPPGDEEDPEAVVRFAAGQVRPLLG